MNVWLVRENGASQYNISFEQLSLVSDLLRIARYVSLCKVYVNFQGSQKERLDPSHPVDKINVMSVRILRGHSHQDTSPKTREAVALRRGIQKVLRS